MTQFIEGEDFWKVALPPPPEDISFADRLRLMAVAGDGAIWSSRPTLSLLEPEDAAEEAPRQIQWSAPCSWPETALFSSVLTESECVSIISLLEATGGFGPGRAVASGPESVRRNDVLVWVAPARVMSLIWRRLGPQVREATGRDGGGLNARLRCYRYGPGQAFLPHHDASQQATELSHGGKQIHESEGRRSRLSCLMYLNSPAAAHQDLGSIGFKGGATALLPAGEAGGVVRVHPEAGSVLIFPHGDHPRSLLHAGEPVAAGTKYVLRTDVF